MVRVVKLCSWLKWWMWYAWVKESEVFPTCTWRHLIRQVQRGGPVSGATHTSHYNWWNISISLSTLRICLCESYHLTRPPSQQLCSQISLSLMRCKFTNCHSNEMQFKHVIPHVITLKISNHMNWKANLITLPLIQVEIFHTTWLSQLEQEVSIIGLPSNYTKKQV